MPERDAGRLCLAWLTRTAMKRLKAHSFATTQSLESPCKARGTGRFQFPGDNSERT